MILAFIRNSLVLLIRLCEDMLTRKVKILIILALVLQAVPSARAANLNADQLIGTWSIYNSNNQVIDSIEITVAVSQKNRSRFSYKQGSHLDLKENSLQGFLFGDYMVFDLINMGFTQTYIAELDFTTDTGAGIEIKTQLADCVVVGINEDLVKKKQRNRLAVDSAQCDSSSLFDSGLSDIKIVKSTADINNVSSDNQASSQIINKESKYQNKIEGVWSIQGINPSLSRRLVIKDLSAHHLGYRFTYRLLNNQTPLVDISESDFETGDRVGFIVNDYMMINPSRFNKNNELFLLRLDTSTLETAKGKELRATNSDCFELKNPSPNQLICTPNDSSPKTANLVTSYGSRSASKTETNLNIDF